jgi:hypothetical protein
MKPNRMMRLACTAALLITVSAALHAQDAEKKEKPLGWQNTLVAGFNLTQVSLHEWTQGGENTLAWAFLLNGNFSHVQADWTWQNILKLTYGQTKLGDAEFEKTDDELFWESIYSRNIGWPVDPYVANQLRTQVAPGYAMVKNEQSGLDERVQTSGFFDPGYLVQSIGFKYGPTDAFYTRLGVAFKETFSGDYGFADDKNTPDEIETFRFQTGLESATGVKFTVMENVLFTSQLNLFSAFENLDVWNVRWDTSINAKVNDYMNTSLNVLVVHEPAQTLRTQVKQVLALGLRYTLL